MSTVCVFGGTGFLGRRLVQRLAADGATLRIAVRSPSSDASAVRADVRDRQSVAPALAGADAVVNVVSAYVEKRDITFESVHVHGARILAE
jgi:NADH dehydrogenase